MTSVTLQELSQEGDTCYFCSKAKARFWVMGEAVPLLIESHRPRDMKVRLSPLAIEPKTRGSSISSYPRVGMVVVVVVVVMG